MKRAIIVLGDPLSSGGSVTETLQTDIKLNGEPIATIEDKVNCPLAEILSNDNEDEKHFEIYDEQIVAVDSNNNPIDNLPYLIVFKEGQKKFGRTDIEGKTIRIKVKQSCDVSIYWGDEALALIENSDN